MNTFSISLRRACLAFAVAGGALTVLAAATKGHPATSVGVPVSASDAATLCGGACKAYSDYNCGSGGGCIGGTRFFEDTQGPHLNQKAVTASPCFDGLDCLGNTSQLDNCNSPFAPQ